MADGFQGSYLFTAVAAVFVVAVIFFVNSIDRPRIVDPADCLRSATVSPSTVACPGF